MADDNKPVAVLFRADHTRRGGAGERIEITAVFPTRPGTVGDPDSMECYAHIGQHSTCSVGWYREKTRPAKPDEYASLARELQGLGYQLDIRERLTNELHAARRAETAMTLDNADDAFRDGRSAKTAGDLLLTALTYWRDGMIGGVTFASYVEQIGAFLQEQQS